MLMVYSMLIHGKSNIQVALDGASMWEAIFIKEYLPKAFVLQ